MDKLKKLGMVHPERWFEFSQELGLRKDSARPLHVAGYKTERYNGTLPADGTAVPVTVRVAHYAGGHYVFARDHRDAIKQHIYDVNRRQTAPEKPPSAKPPYPTYPRHGFLGLSFHD